MKRYAFIVLSFCAVALAASTARAGNADVSIKSGGNEYHPDIVHIGVGETVTWTNDDRTLFPTNHTVTADDGSFDSGTIRERNSFDYTFTSPGSFTYHCSIHAGMSGTVVVAARAPRTPTPTVAPTRTVRPSPRPSASKSPKASPNASSTASATPSIDPSNVSSNNSSAGSIISIAIVSIAVLIGLGYFVYLRLVRDR
jgi:plastocyanin